MKRGLMISAIFVAIMLVSFSAFVSAQAINSGAKTGINFNPDQGVANAKLDTAPLGAPEASASAEAKTNENDEEALGCTLEGRVKTCSISGYPKFSVDASVKIQMVNGEVKLIATSSDKDATITLLETGEKRILKPGATFAINNNVVGLSNWCTKILNRKNVVITPTAVAAVRGTEETGFSKLLDRMCAWGNKDKKVRTSTAAVRGTEETGFSKLFKGITTRFQAKNKANTNTPVVVAAVRGTEE